jgi:hypothetical protein
VLRYHETVSSARPRIGQWNALIFVASAAVVLWSYRNVASAATASTLAGQIAWLIVFTLAAWGLGAPLALRALSESAAVTVVGLAAGAGTLAIVAALFGALGLLQPLPLVLVLSAAALAGLHRLVRGGILPSPAAVPALAAAVLVIVGALTLLAAGIDSAFYDQLNYHLAFPAQWLRAHRLITFPRHDYSFLPATMGLLYTYALAGLPVWAAQALHWWMGGLAVAGTAVLAGRGRSGWWAAAFLAATPAVMLSATWAASDLAAVAFAVAAWITIVAALEGRESGRAAPWVLAGCLVGLAVGAKLLVSLTVAVPLGIIALVTAAPGSWPGLRGRVTRAALLTGGAIATMLPWLLRNLIATGNPFYPVGTHSPVAGGLPVAPGGLAAWLAVRLRAFQLGTFDPRGAAGDIGPIYLLLAPLVLIGAVRRREPRTLLLLGGAALGILGWSFLPPLGRYLLAPLALLAALGGAAWDAALASMNRPLRIASLALLAFAMAWGATRGVSSEVFARAACALGLENPRTFREVSVNYLGAATFINASLPANARILLVAEARTLYIERDVIAEDPFQTPYLTVLAERSPDAAAMARSLADDGVTHLLVNWSEARRMAALNHRNDYFGAPSPAVQSRIQEFFAKEVKRVWSDGTVEVDALLAPETARVTP